MTVPGPTVTTMTPGPTVTATRTVPGPTVTKTVPGPTRTVTKTVTRTVVRYRVPRACLNALATAKDLFQYAADGAEASANDDAAGIDAATAGIVRLTPVWQDNRDACQAAAGR